MLAPAGLEPELEQKQCTVFKNSGWKSVASVDWATLPASLQGDKQKYVARIGMALWYGITTGMWVISSGTGMSKEMRANHGMCK
jgi:hypothetical protein